MDARIELVVALLVTGCGRFGFEGDADADAGAGADALAADVALFCGDLTIDLGEDCDDGNPNGGDGCSPSCAAEPDFDFGSFGPSTVVSVSLEGVYDDDPSLTDDLLEIFVSSGRPGGPGLEDVWTATRSSRDGPWGAPTVVPVVNSVVNENAPVIAPDGLSLWFGSERLVPGDHDLYVATRAARDQPWQAPVHVDELSTAADEYAAAVDTSGRVLVFSRFGAANLDLSRSTRVTSAAPWSAPVPITELNTVGEDFNPFERAGRLILFTSNRAGTRDLWIAKRASPTDTYSAPVPIAELNTPDLDQDPWLSPDLRYLVYGCGQDLCEARRQAMIERWGN